MLDEFGRVARMRVEHMRGACKRGPGLRAIAERVIRSGRAVLIYEFKRCSPRGFVAYMTPREFIERIGAYADAVSVLTEPYWFCGSLELIPFFASHKPVLAKDFVVSEEQVEAYASLCASAVLLILDLLGWEGLDKLYTVARSHGLDALIETSGWRDAVEVAHSYPEALVGINSRNLHTLRLDFGSMLEGLRRASERVPSGTILVAESGIDSVEKARMAVGAGAHALLIGTFVMKEPEAAARLREVVKLS